MTSPDLWSTFRLARCYPTPTFAWYSACKMLTDPVYGAVAGRLGTSELPLLDLGCGLGLCAFYLREAGFRGGVRGIDSDERKIAAAVTVAQRRGEAMRFECASVLDPEVLGQIADHRGHVVMLDVLHYLEPASQEVLLRHIAEALVPGAWAILRLTPRTGGWRFRMTRAEERVMQMVGWVRRTRLHFPTIEQVAAPFESKGHAAEVVPLWGRTPFNSYLFVARHRG